MYSRNQSPFEIRATGWSRLLATVAASLVLLTTLPACTGTDGQPQGESKPPVTESTEPASCELNPPAKAVMCTQQYDPVCGCDGKTYGNACTAGAAGVPRHTPGACADRARLD